MVLSAMFIAIIILQSFVPFLGNLPLVVLDITIIHITVIVGGIVLGPQAGFLLGFTWGMCSFFRAFTSGSPISLLIFTNPLISVLPRLVMGGLVALFYHIKFDLLTDGKSICRINRENSCGIADLLNGRCYDERYCGSVGCNCNDSNYRFNFS